LKLYIFRIKFLAKKVVFSVSRGKNQISRLLGHLEKFFGYPWKNPPLPPPGKNPSDAHVGVGGYSKLAHQKQLRKVLLLVLLSVSDYLRAYASLYFIITNFHMELKPQVKVSHGMNYLAFILYAMFD